MPASVGYKFVSLCLSKQQSRTEQIQWTPLVCPSPTPRGGMGGLAIEGGRERAPKELLKKNW